MLLPPLDGRHARRRDAIIAAIRYAAVMLRRRYAAADSRCAALLRICRYASLLMLFSRHYAAIFAYHATRRYADIYA